MKVWYHFNNHPYGKEGRKERALNLSLGPIFKSFSDIYKSFFFFFEAESPNHAEIPGKVF